MVAPSLVTVIYTSGDYNILSIPFGPIELLNVLEIVLAALIFALKASTPLMRFFYSCSLITIKGLPNSSNAKLIFCYTYILINFI